MIVDAHHHLWDFSRGPLRYPWLQDTEPHEFFLGDYSTLKRDYLPADYRRMTRDFTPAERQALFHDNAARFYRLGMPNARVVS